MKKDFLTELEYLGVTARIKRLSDVFSASIKELYKYADLDIEPSWHLIFLFLKKEKTTNMSDIAEAFRLSQPAATKMISRMIKKGYLICTQNKSDSRKKDLTLSEKAKMELPKFEKVWNAGQKSIREILRHNNEFLMQLEKLEEQIEETSFTERAIAHLNNDEENNE